MNHETLSDNLTRGTLKAAVLAISLIALLGFWASTSAFAGPRDRNIDRRPEPPIARRVGLSPDQKSNILQVWQSAKRQAQQLRQSPDLTPDQKQEGIQTLKRQTQDQVNQILTPDQRQKLQQIRQQMQGQDRTRTFGLGVGQNLGVGPGPRRDLGNQPLTPDQRQRLLAARQQMRQQDNR